jgi:hypothetical protein
MSNEPDKALSADVERRLAYLEAELVRVWSRMLSIAERMDETLGVMQRMLDDLSTRRAPPASPPSHGVN